VGFPSLQRGCWWKGPEAAGSRLLYLPLEAAEEDVNFFDLSGIPIDKENAVCYTSYQEELLIIASKYNKLIL